MIEKIARLGFRPARSNPAIVETKVAPKGVIMRPDRPSSKACTTMKESFKGAGAKALEANTMTLKTAAMANFLAD